MARNFPEGLSSPNSRSGQPHLALKRAPRKYAATPRGARAWGGPSRAGHAGHPGKLRVACLQNEGERRRSAEDAPELEAASGRRAGPGRPGRAGCKSGALWGERREFRKAQVGECGAIDRKGHKSKSSGKTRREGGRRGGRSSASNFRGLGCKRPEFESRLRRDPFFPSSSGGSGGSPRPYSLKICS